MSIIDKSIQKLEAAQKLSKTKKSSDEQPIVSEDASTMGEVTAEYTEQKQTAKATSEKHIGSYVDLNHHELIEKGFLAELNEKSVHSEEFRSLKRKVISNAFGSLSHTLDANNLIMVTSCSPGEGKTFNAINLALSIAQEKDKTVLLVDSDVLRPSISKHLGIDAEFGLTDYLNGKVDDLRDVMLTTSIEKLRVLPAGNFYTLSSELLASNKMVELVNEFSSRYKDRIVIFDAPPMLGINETAVLAELVGQILIVVEEDETKLSNIQSLLNLLPEKVAKGFVLNKAVTSNNVSYGYGY